MAASNKFKVTGRSGTFLLEPKWAADKHRSVWVLPDYAGFTIYADKDRNNRYVFFEVEGDNRYKARLEALQNALYTRFAVETRVYAKGGIYATEACLNGTTALAPQAVFKAVLLCIDQTAALVDWEL